MKRNFAMAPPMICGSVACIFNKIVSGYERRMVLAVEMALVFSYLFCGLWVLEILSG